MKYIIALIIFGFPFFAFAADTGRETGLPTPRFVSLKADEVNLRKGPGTRYPIEWVFRRKNMQVEVMEEFGHWRRIRDIDGSTGWLHKQMLSGQRTAIINHPTLVTLREDPDSNAHPIAKLEPGVIAYLKKCTSSWCELEAGSYEGWLLKSKLYGAYDKELYNP